MARRTRAMRLRHEEFNWLPDAAPQVFWIAGADGKICFLSERFADLTGMDLPDAIKDDRWKAVVCPDDLPSLSALWQFAQAGASESCSYFRMCMRDGNYHWMQSVGRPVHSPRSGAITHWVGALMDVDTDFQGYRSVEEVNRKLSARIEAETSDVAGPRWYFHTLFHDRNIGVIEIDLAAVKPRLDALRRAGVEDLPRFLDGNPAVAGDLIDAARTLKVTPALAVMLGCTGDGAVPLQLKSIHRGPGPLLRQAVAALFTGNDRFDGIADLTMANGRRLNIAYAINISDDLTCRATLVDITEQQMGAELQLAVQYDLARADRVATIGALSISIAHELNQPITSMRIELQSLARAVSALGISSGPVQVGLERVTRQSERLTQIIQRTRDRVMNPRRRVAAIDIASLVEEVPLLLHREIEEGVIALHIEIPETPCLVQADAVELQQVLVNLVMNAIEAMRSMPADARRVRLCVDQAGDLARVRVIDTGPGIPEADRAHIFDPFYTTKAGGVGMGLQICRSIVEALGGDLRARDARGGGAIFEFCIPNQHLNCLADA